MDSQLSLSPVDYDPYSNARQSEGTWSPDSYIHTRTRTPDSYQYTSTQGSPQALEDAGVLAADHPATLNDINATGGYPRPFDVPNFTLHPVRGMLPVNRRDGTVMMVYGPPLPPDIPNCLDFSLLSQEYSQVMVPQPPYVCGNTQKDWDQKPPILFFKWGRLGMKLSDAMKKEFKGMDDRDKFPFEDKRGITIRIHFPGYPSSTDVEKKLKQLPKESGKNLKARSMQLSTKNYKAQAEPVTKSKLVQEVAKRIEWHIEDLERNSDLFPFDDRSDGRWRLGQGKMRFEHMMITGLVNVSSGSWSPMICIE